MCMCYPAHEYHKQRYFVLYGIQMVYIRNIRHSSFIFANTANIKIHIFKGLSETRVFWRVILKWIEYESNIGYRDYTSG